MYVSSHGSVRGDKLRDFRAPFAVFRSWIDSAWQLPDFFAEVTSSMPHTVDDIAAVQILHRFLGS